MSINCVSVSVAKCSETVCDPIKRSSVCVEISRNSRSTFNDWGLESCTVMDTTEIIRGIAAEMRMSFTVMLREWTVTPHRVKVDVLIPYAWLERTTVVCKSRRPTTNGCRFHHCEVITYQYCRQTSRTGCVSWVLNLLTDFYARQHIGATFNDPEWARTPVSRSRYSLKANILQTMHVTAKYINCLMHLQWVYCLEDNITTFSNDTNAARSLSNSRASCLLCQELFGICKRWIYM